MNELRDSGVDPLIIDAGDLFFSTENLNSTNKKSELYRAAAILEGYNRVGCDAIKLKYLFSQLIFVIHKLISYYLNLSELLKRDY